MKKPILIGAALLLSTAAIGAALAAARGDFLEGHRQQVRQGVEAAGEERPALLLAEQSQGRDSSARRHHEEDDDDDDEGGGRGAIPQAAPADPNAPVPDNGLFKGHARPKVEVQ